MYTESDSYCTIGKPKGVVSVRDGSSTISKIGGSAVWHDKTTAPQTNEEICCGVCKLSDSMVLVAQIYAPIDHHRSLYVFGCNNRKCSYSSRGWTVVRNQSASKSESTVLSNGSIIEVAKSEKNSLPQSLKNTKEHTAVSWDDFSFDASPLPMAPNSSVAVVDDVDDDDDDDMSDLLALLAIRKTSLAKDTPTPALDTPALSKAVVTKAASDIDGSIFMTKSVLPSYRLVEVPDEWWGGGPEDDGEDAEDDSADQHSAQPDAHINALIQSYLETEDDPEVLGIMRGEKAQPVVSSSDLKTEVTTTAEEESTTTSLVDRSDKVKKTKTNLQPSKKHGSNARNESDDDEEASEGRFALSGAKSRAEQYFQRRVALCPSQALRYAYGGQPLWITHPSPLHSKGFAGVNQKNGDVGVTGEQQISAVPCCEMCGATRVFECQLMPALLSYIADGRNTSESSDGNSSSSGGKGGSSLLQADRNERDKLLSECLGSGLDFGVVAIYSCPSSCDARDKGRFATEVAVVQMPPDIKD